MGSFDLLNDDDPRAVAHEERKLLNKLEVKKEIAVSKFKVGQKVYCILSGLGEVTGIDPDSNFGVEATFTNKKLGYYSNKGRLVPESINPTLLTLEEARTKGYDVPKQKIVKEKTVYINLYESKAGMASQVYVYTDEELARSNNKANVSNGKLAIAYPVTIKYEIEE